MMPVLKMSVRVIVSTCAALAMATSLAVAAPAVVKVSLSDKGATTDLPTGLGLATPGADMSKSMMHVTASPTAVRAGEVTFDVTNASKDTVHEMILVKLGAKDKPLPYVADENRVDEDAAGHLGEVSELDPGASGKLTLKLDAGTYMLFCNIPGHYMAGMWTLVTVK